MVVFSALISSDDFNCVRANGKTSRENEEHGHSNNTILLGRETSLVLSRVVLCSWGMGIYKKRSITYSVSWIERS